MKLVASLKSLNLLYVLKDDFAPTQGSHHTSLSTTAGTTPTTPSSPSFRQELISKLDILEPDFYSVFSDSEIQMLFSPRAPRIPIYIWDNPKPFADMIEACLASLPRENRCQYDNEFFLYEGLVNSRHRVYNPDEALLHYIPFYMRDCANKSIAEVENIVLGSRHYKRYGGANFITEWNHWQIFLDAKKDSDDMFTGEILEPRKRLSFGICHDQTNNGDFCQCHIPTASSPQAPPLLFDGITDIMDRPWPPYNTTQYSNFSDLYFQTRHFNLIFVGKMDGRLAYSDRVDNTRQCSKYGEPSVYIQTIAEGDNKNFVLDLPECSLPVNVSSEKSIVCLHNVFPQKVDFDRLMSKSKFGWHHRGDTAHSARMADLFNTLTLPLITSELLDDSTTPFQCTIPFDALSFYVPPRRFEHCDQIVDELMNVSHVEIEKKLRLLYYYRPYYINGQLSWDALLKETASRCLSSSMLAEFNFSVSDFPCIHSNRYKVHRLPKLPEVDESPVFQI